MFSRHWRWAPSDPNFFSIFSQVNLALNSLSSIQRVILELDLLYDRYLPELTSYWWDSYRHLQRVSKPCLHYQDQLFSMLEVGNFVTDIWNSILDCVGWFSPKDWRNEITLSFLKKMFFFITNQMITKNSTYV